MCAHAIAEDLDQIHHVEEARNLQPYEAAAHRHWRARIIQYGRSMTPTTGFALIPRVSRVAGRLRVPGDKSISHRYAMLAAIADGTSRLTGYAPGADCAATLACLEALGVAGSEAPAIVIRGPGPARPPRAGGAARRRQLRARRCGCSSGLLAGASVHHRHRWRRLAVTPAHAPRDRAAHPHGRDPSTPMHGRPPLTIHGADLHGISHHPEVPSAQVKSAVLLAGLMRTGGRRSSNPRRHGIIRSGPWRRSAARSSATARPFRLTAVSACTPSTRRCAGRHLVGALLAGARGRYT